MFTSLSLYAIKSLINATFYPRDNVDFRYIGQMKEKCGMRLQGQVSGYSVATL